ncbi:AmmeMemoRadiSam system protein A [Nitrosomonas sp. Is37]|uniref:AmmeMemoRadiSam system protein A n=1 Tax=Nitrosomonas sp. Is37 TaxID=3080535 RepID=UPI00294AFE95|nr:AmmeMemoRadiSam system protein A [Nitrosomonas sp. Is37]MDV6343567.1 AmmeMemoRadiSam system protein A [Nitrosomonas sp. Is37]
MLPNQGKELLSIGRSAIACALNIPYRSKSDEHAPWLQELSACFVTLMQDGRLRGCIGSLEAQRSLLMDVKSNAVSAALHDPRFVPLRAAEFDDIHIEISLLSPRLAMAVQDEADALAQLRPGIDGIVFEYGCYRSTFLPQVWEELSQPLQFLALLKRKAGLPADFWAEGVKLSRYTVTKWREIDNVEEYPNG